MVTCSLTVTLHWADLSPSTVVTVMIVSPTPTGVTLPSKTVATDPSLLDHVTFLFVASSGMTCTNNCNFIDLQPEEYERVINTNLVSMMHMCHLALPYMVDRDTAIVCTASVGGLTGVINQADYCAAKTGVIGLCRALALEFAPRKVRVNSIAPGMIMTDMLKGVNQDELNALAATIPLGHIGEPKEIAGALEYILTADYLTGQVISPNGGFVLQ